MVEPLSTGPLAAYRARIETGRLRHDPSQEAAIARLEALAQRLAEAPPRARNGIWHRLRPGRNDRPPRGVYLHGPVGCGKSMLMDLFFEHAPIEAKRRVHFHEFMLEVHDRLHAHRQRPSAEDEPLGRLARELARETRLLCFDEFGVHNIADAMILGRLFEALFEDGVVVVATSNFPPERLYEGGLNRDRFVSFIDLLQRRLEVVAMTGIDYRLERLRDMRVYHSPLGPESEAQLASAFAALTDEAEAQPEIMAVNSRRLVVPKAAHGVAWFAFGALCEQPLGAADYLALTDRYHAVILQGVPRLTPDRRNEARRLITLIDALYERRIKLIVSAEAAPGELYPDGEGAFEFRRTASRLAEMQSREYLESAKVPLQPGVQLGAFALTTDLT